MTQPAVSDVTAALIELLAQWPRRVLQAAIEASPSPVDEIVSGELGRTLESLQRTRPDKDVKQERTRYIDMHTHNPRDCVAGYFDEDFPARLREIADPPLLLFYQGDLTVLREPTVAVVGARRASSSGSEVARSLGQELAAAGPPASTRPRIAALCAQEPQQHFSAMVSRVFIRPGIGGWRRTSSIKAGSWSANIPTGRRRARSVFQNVTV